MACVVANNSSVTFLLRTNCVPNVFCNPSICDVILLTSPPNLVISVRPSVSVCFNRNACSLPAPIFFAILAPLILVFFAILFLKV